ncbi:GlxA family transcriptional regulator [Paracoccus sulfuroxidans]|uniref:Transcriptional regulator, AraC family with amidase-like domain n=1 Tax=Paracoccus sulfuroxidans TaxID=384678 RepID=A0A562NGW7_9RHOB|nr:GlxA family transcriptional regulator [Paracoccus sulfuroxidans]TWI31449.1 transcriptional regulator, AraC family with amidase-like domain [Paracoccus sulfuroxidans]
MQPISPFHLTFLLFEGFSNMVLANAIEPLRAARDLSGQRLFSWQIASMEGGSVLSSSRLTVGSDVALDRVGATDALIVVSGYGIRDHLRRKTLQGLLNKARGLPLIGGFDTGAWMLAEAGLLAGRRATIHWMETEALAEAFPEIEVIAAPYVTDGNTVTCGGAQGVLNWSLDLIGAHADDALRYDVANMFTRTHVAPTESSSPRMTDRALPAPMMRAVVAMRESAENPEPLSRIADRAALTTRSMDRLFHTHLGMPAGRYYRIIRLSHARALAIETSLPLEDIAARTGFASAATLARAYRAHFGETVRGTRRG